jgi:hypothetical protein
MDGPTSFQPARNTGIIFQGGFSAALLGATGFCLWQAVTIKSDSGFLIYLAFSLACFIPTPVLLYRLYSLFSGYYRLERDGLRLRWGLRYEDIPLADVEWVRPASEVAALVPGNRLPMPWMPWPGALVGVRTAESLGPIEYLASTMNTLLLVATSNRIYAISPLDPAAFLQAFDGLMEMGSLSPIAHRSVYPSVLPSRIWSDHMARNLILAGMGAGIILLITSVVVIPMRANISLGFSPQGEALTPGPSNHILLLPVLNILAFLIDTVGGTYLYRRREQQPVAYLLWAASLLTPLSMFIGIIFIFKA